MSATRRTFFRTIIAAIVGVFVPARRDKVPPHWGDIVSVTVDDGDGNIYTMHASEAFEHYDPEAIIEAREYAMTTGWLYMEEKEG